MISFDLLISFVSLNCKMVRLTLTNSLSCFNCFFLPKIYFLVIIGLPSYARNLVNILIELANSASELANIFLSTPTLLRYDSWFISQRLVVSKVFIGTLYLLAIVKNTSKPILTWS